MSAHRVTDADAMPLLLDVMAAAGHHDGPACLRLLDQAEATLPRGFHQSRADIGRARTAVSEQDWRLVWRAAWGATTGLTWAFPPDPAVCPPEPGAEPFATLRRASQPCPSCGHVEPILVRFCPLCGCAAT